MSKQTIDYGFGVIETKETYYTEETINKLNQRIAELQKQLEEKEKIIQHWHNLYKKRDQQFQSVRQRYHLLNKLQSNYNKKDKLHLLGMQCLELVKENEELQKQLEEKEKGNKQLAIEELENLKNFFLEPYKDEEMDTDFLITKDEGSIADYILDRIKELKGEE